MVLGFFWAEFGIWSGVFLTSVVEIILQIRLHALYNKNKKIFAMVSVLFFCEVASMCVIGGLYTHLHVKSRAFAVAVPGTPFCKGVTPSFLFAFQIPLMGFDFILLCLVLYRCIAQYRNVPDKSWSTAVIMSIIIRDSVLYFLSVFLVYLLNTVMWSAGPTDLFPLASTWAVVIPTTACSRLLINMKKAGASSHHHVSLPECLPALSFKHSDVGSQSTQSDVSSVVDIRRYDTDNSV
ncbi:hypothetical protein Hypma_013830 [Hypsizygus marmoreus]|uniref:Uncharacterized protein n=1 Tax=Hypsizygus marmoreus TaxID=39966 RepID=A0A369K782_HYPMA|nr:hypothetical protein Hypma_013830 [Hypsizygus marmoreus]